MSNWSERTSLAFEIWKIWKTPTLPYLESEPKWGLWELWLSFSRATSYSGSSSPAPRPRQFLVQLDGSVGGAFGSSSQTAAGREPSPPSDGRFGCQLSTQPYAAGQLAAFKKLLWPQADPRLNCCWLHWTSWQLKAGKGLQMSRLHPTTLPGQPRAS